MLEYLTDISKFTCLKLDSVPSFSPPLLKNKIKQNKAKTNNLRLTLDFSFSQNPIPTYQEIPLALLQNISRLLPSLTSSTAPTLVQVMIIISQLINCSTPLTGLPPSTFDPFHLFSPSSLSDPFKVEVISCIPLVSNGSPFHPEKRHMQSWPALLLLPILLLLSTSLIPL